MDSFARWIKNDEVRFFFDFIDHLQHVSGEETAVGKAVCLCVLFCSCNSFFHDFHADHFFCDRCKDLGDGSGSAVEVEDRAVFRLADELAGGAVENFRAKGIGLEEGEAGEPAVNALNEAVKVADSFSEEGKTALFFAEKDRLLGIIAVADVIKTDSPEAVRQLKNMGIHVVMLTGDNEKTARTIGTQAGVDEVIAGVLPDEKAEAVGRFKSRGKVIMVGDGINDAPALTSADIGLAIGAGTDIAIDAADVVLMKSRLSDVVTAIRLSRATLRNIHENLFWAFIYNIIGIPLAAGVWIQLFGWTLNPMFGAAAMSLSSFCVVTNALRLNLFKD